uniref:Uncharacterized protein n=1 Tax=Aegilops tauschii subsp. strangulata TaxID=200361 RepID=A0A453PDF9_AEGTS
MWGQAMSRLQVRAWCCGDGQQGRTRARAALLQEALQRDATEELQPPVSEAATVIWCLHSDGRQRRLPAACGDDTSMARRKAATGKDFCWNRRHVLLGPAGRCATTVTQGRRRCVGTGKTNSCNRQ